MTTAHITDEQIETLRAEAINAGDFAQVEVCNRALARVVPQHALDDTKAAARAECVRVIEAAKAQGA